MSPKITIFGGTGTLGSVLVDECSNAMEVTYSHRVPGSSSRSESFYFDFQTPQFTAAIFETLRISDAVIVNAAVSGDGLLLSMSEHKIQETLRVNLEVPLMIAKHYLRERVSLGVGGKVIFISSIAAQTGYSGLAVYGASKAGLEAAVRALAREMGSRDFYFFAIAPGFFPSKLSESLGQGQLDRIRRRSPSGALVEPSHIARLATQLCLGDHLAQNGRVLTLDFGNTI